MIAKGQHVMVDTMVIIEAHRTRCWNALVGQYRMDTVCRCIEECDTGNQRRRNPVPIDTAALRERVVPKTVTPVMIYEMEQRLAGRVDLDPGERELLAYCITQADAWIISSPDKAAMRAGMFLGILDRFVSLESLTVALGLSPELRDNFTNRWQTAFRTQLLLN
jgi:hypothetical protein